MVKFLLVTELPRSGTVFLKFGVEGPLKKLRHLGLTLRKGMWRFPSWLRALADYRQYQDVWWHWYDGRASSSNRQGIIWVLISYDEILKEWKRSLSCQISMSDSCKSSSGNRSSPPPPVLLDTVIETTCLQFKRKCFLLQYLFFCQILYLFFKFLVKCKYIFLLCPNIVWNHPPHFNIVFMGKSLSNYVISNNVAGFWTATT